MQKEKGTVRVHALSGHQSWPACGHSSRTYVIPLSGTLLDGNISETLILHLRKSVEKPKVLVF